MEIEKMNIEEIEARVAEIRSSLETADVETLEAMNTELDSLETRKNALKAEAMAKAEEARKIAEGEVGETIENLENMEERKMAKTFEEIRSSQEYMDAFAKMIKSGDATEIRTMATELVSGTVPVPTSIEPVIEKAWEKLQIADKARALNIKGLLKVPYEVSADGAVVHTENGEAPAEEALVLGSVTLTPETIKKWITITDEALSMSAFDFLSYIYEEIAYQVMLKLDAEVVAKIKASSLVKAVSVTAFDAFSIFAGLAVLADDAVAPVAIMKKETFFNKFMSLADAQGRPIYTVVSENGAPKFSINGCPVIFSSAAGNDVIVGDMNGVTINYQNGKDVSLITDPYSLAEEDKVKVVGKIMAGIGVTKPNFLAVISESAG